MHDPAFVGTSVANLAQESDWSEGRSWYAAPPPEDDHDDDGVAEPEDQSLTQSQRRLQAYLLDALREGDAGAGGAGAYYVHPTQVHANSTSGRKTWEHDYARNRHWDGTDWIYE